MANYHEPVLLEKVIECLDVKPDGFYVDATFGGGGHGLEILKKLKNGKLIAFDQDEDAEANLPDDDRVMFFNHNFRFIKNFLQLNKLVPLDGLFADLGVSSHQLEIPGRGFSTRFSGPLDMRMNQSSELTAADIVNDFDEQHLSKIFRHYGELKNADKLAKIIIKERGKKRIQNTYDLVGLIENLTTKNRRNKFLAQVFQALRIEVNDEINALKELLQQSVDILKTGGRLVIISYHSIEDRLVKNFMKAGNFEGIVHKDFYGNKLTPFEVIHKFVVPGEEEIMNNNRARSAKLRTARKIATND